MEGSSISHFISATNVHVLSNRHQDCPAGLPLDKATISVQTCDLRVRWLRDGQMSCLHVHIRRGCRSPYRRSLFLFLKGPSAKLFFHKAPGFNSKNSIVLFLPLKIGGTHLERETPEDGNRACVFFLIVFLLTILLPSFSVLLMVFRLLVWLQLFIEKEGWKGF